MPLFETFKNNVSPEQDANVFYLLPTLIKPKNPGLQGKNAENLNTEPPKKQRKGGKVTQKFKSRASEPEYQEAFFIVVPVYYRLQSQSRGGNCFFFVFIFYNN